MDTMTLGDVEITRVVEMPVLRMGRGWMYPDDGQRLWRDHGHWLVPDFLDPASDEVLMTVQSWLLRGAGRTILVDTGIGNAKERPGSPAFHHLDLDFFGALERAGTRPEDVDVVVCTHLHADHAGGNTRLVDGAWVPAFPRARYVAGRAESAYWKAENLHRTRAGAAMAGVFEDSVEPVARAGQLDLWEDHCDLGGGLRLESAPGHTPGAAVLRLRSGSDRAVFVGDMLHSPLQIAEPDCCPVFDEDPGQARATRRAVLGRAAEEGELVIPAHFPTAGAVEVERRGDRFAVREWLLRP
ncbi:MBL fold metallo-hydrolase [Streptomyces sp. B1866]|uniref:MBL fold metallo-hydrolase n=1 Tax=Streptomyces sp. B1866 TaxID=3075431 RepID=UPI0028906B9E|nr:MBL fold metallo-hydrolase [Streptomyces sp. B1866]MDT3396859.1 MBL fold metallo-hydrolase [Streptomyces sp. B1866]